MGRSALVIGASGLIGRNVVFELLKQPVYEKVTVLARKDLVIKHEKLHQVLLDFDDLTKYASEFSVDDVFCCMGTTRAKTPDPEQYRKIDYTYPLTVARMALEHGAKQYLLVSSMGANKDSTLFYSRLKGEVEAAIAALNYTSYQVFRPSLLLGWRNESRPLETVSQSLMRVLNPLFFGPLRLYKAIKGQEVAKAMVRIALKGEEGHHVYLNNRILELAGS